MAFGLGDNQKVTLGVVGIDEANNSTTPPDGVFIWTVADPALLAIDSVSEDTLRAVISAVGPLGTTTVTAASADFTGVGEISVLATEAVSLALVTGTPEHK